MRGVSRGKEREKALPFSSLRHWLPGAFASNICIFALEDKWFFVTCQLSYPGYDIYYCGQTIFESSLMS
jgi:hypothetical protein